MIVLRAWYSFRRGGLLILIEKRGRFRLSIRVSHFFPFYWRPWCRSGLCGGYGLNTPPTNAYIDVRWFKVRASLTWPVRPSRERRKDLSEIFRLPLAKPAS